MKNPTLLENSTLKRGYGKYKGKLPLKCYSYGGIVHFTNKCLHRDNNGNDDYIRNSRSSSSKNNEINFRKEKHNKRSFISK